MKNLVKKLFIVFFTIIMLMSTAVYNIKAEDTVEVAGASLEDTPAVKLALKTTDEYLITDIPRLDENSIIMVPGVTYEATYKDALDYFGQDLTVVVTAKLSNGGSAAADSARIFINPNGLVEIGWTLSYNVMVDYTVSVYDKDGNAFDKGQLLFGFYDPDESNYLFDTANRDLYYTTTKFSTTPPPTEETLNNYNEYLAQSYVVKSNGLILVDNTGKEWYPSEWPTTKNTPTYNNGLFLVKMHGNSFEFQTNTFKNGGFDLPYFYSLKGVWNVSYILNDSETTPADNSGNVDPDAPKDPEKSFIEYESGVGFEKEIANPTRPGYTFKGWTRKDVTDPTSEDNKKIQIYDFGDKVFEANWEAQDRDYVVEYYYMDDQGKYPKTATESETRTAKVDDTVTVTDDDKTPTKNDYVLDESEKADPIYEEVITPDGKTVLKVYFKKSLTVTYKPGTQGTFAEQVNPELDYGVDTPEFKGTPEGNEGYDFVGWDKEIADTVTENAVYVAQWEPWKYFIKYDPNGGEGDMPKQTFVYSDDVMNSKKNEFTRSGYEFLGFEFENDGTKYIITSTKDFNKMLKELGPNSTITLVAQWKKLPDPVVKYYALPVTGVE